MKDNELRMLVAQGVERLVVRNGWSVEEGARELGMDPSDLESVLLGFDVPMSSLVHLTEAVERMLNR